MVQKTDEARRQLDAIIKEGYCLSCLHKANHHAIGSQGLAENWDTPSKEWIECTFLIEGNTYCDCHKEITQETKKEKPKEKKQEKKEMTITEWMVSKLR